MEEVHAAEEALGRRTFEPRLAGDHFSVREGAARCFDLPVGWVPEKTFEEAYALYDEALAGEGGIRGRLRGWTERHELPGEKTSLLPALVERAVLEARRHTEDLVGLPEGEKVSFGALTGEPFLALAEYWGGLRSRVLVNTDRFFNLADLLYVACHEGYPGHLTEIVLKERHLANEKGQAEELVSFLPTPWFVVSEGLALWARELAFPGTRSRRGSRSTPTRRSG